MPRQRINMKSLAVFVVFCICALGMSICVSAAPLKDNGREVAKNNKLSTPDTNWYVDGEDIILLLSSVNNATNYEYKMSNKNGSFTENIVPIKGLSEGESLSISIRAVNSSNEYAPSDWKTITVSMPDYVYSKIDFSSSFNLSLNQLKKWAKINNLEHAVTETDDYIILSVVKEDEYNNSFKSRMGRGIVNGINGLIDGTQKGVNMLNTKDFLSNTAIDYIESGSLKYSVKNNIDRSKSEIVGTAKKSAINNIIAYTFDDVNFHYDYFFPKDATTRACLYSTMTYEENGHYGIEQNVKKHSYDSNKQMYYVTVPYSNTGCYFYISKTEIVKGYPKMILTQIPFHAAVGYK